MIGKALLSGLWAHPLGCFTVRFTFAILTLARVSLSVSPLFSPLSLRRGVVVVCFEVIRGELLCRSACAMWSRGSWLGGSLVSAWCCVASLTACMALCVFVFPPFLVFFGFVYGHTMMRWHNVVTSCMNLPMNWLPVIPLCGSFLVLFWFRFGGFGLFVLLFAFACFGCWWWRLIGLCTGPSPVHFCGPQQQMASSTNLKLLLLQCHRAC